MSDTTSFAIRHVPGNQRAIVLIHGFSGESHQTFGLLPAFLAGSPALYGWDLHCFGYPTSLCPDISGLWSADPDLSSLSGLLATYLSDGRYKDYREVALVAHSMGGLLLQRAVLDGGFEERVKHVVLFGTPSHGLRKARLGRIFKRQVRDMGWDSDFIRSLRADWDGRYGSGLPFGFASVAGVRDEFVPVPSSLEPFPKQYHRYANGNHLEMVKPRTGEGDAVLLLLSLLGGAGGGGAGGSDTVPSEAERVMRGAPQGGGYADTVRVLGASTHRLQAPDLSRLALALEMTGRQQDAIDMLEKRHGGDPELLGVLGGRHKRRFLADPDGAETEGRRALDLYRQGFEEAKRQGDDRQAYYNGINVAFMALALDDDRAAAGAVAAEVTDHCRRARAAGTADRWATATEGEAALYLGEHDRAVELYRAALAEVFEERERGSMLRQGVWACRLLEADATETRLAALYDPVAPEFPAPRPRG